MQTKKKLLPRFWAINSNNVLIIDKPLVEHKCRVKKCPKTSRLAGPYCRKHGVKILNLRIMKSMYLESIGINGLGLYAYNSKKADRKSAVFKPNTLVRPKPKHGRLYMGDDFTPEELCNIWDKSPDINANAPYALRIGEENYVMDSCLNRGFSAYANDASQDTERINARFVRGGNLLITKEIYHGDEILVSYGPKYWLDGGKGGVSHNTYPLCVEGDASLGILPYTSTITK